MAKTHLEAGFEFRDKDGLLVATMAQNVKAGDPIRAEHFKFEEGFEQKPGDAINPVISKIITPRAAQNWN